MRQGERIWDLRTRPQAHQRERTHSSTNSGQGGIPIRYWEVLSEKAMGHTVPGAGGARVKG